MRKIKILFISHGRVSKLSGVGKVHYDLKEVFEALGHSVDILDISNFPNESRFSFLNLFKSSYNQKIYQYLKANAHKYDVLDSNFECIIHSKKDYGFSGLVFTRSHGLKPLYDRVENGELYKRYLSKRTAPFKLKTFFGNFYRRIWKTTNPDTFFLSLRYADITHCLNSTEYNFLLEQGIDASKIKLLPNGISDVHLTTYNSLQNDIKSHNIVFVGSWTQRKGINDFDEILTGIKEKSILGKVYLLGGNYPPEYVKSFFSKDNQDLLEIVPTFTPESLPDYLKYCKVGFFPSYVEGFGISVVEQIACGIPVIAYNIPGPQDILKSIDDTLLIETGNVPAMVDRIIKVLEMDDIEYNNLSSKCKTRSKQFNLTYLGKEFIKTYEQYTID